MPVQIFLDVTVYCTVDVDITVYIYCQTLSSNKSRVLWVYSIDTVAPIYKLSAIL